MGIEMQVRPALGWPERVGRLRGIPATGSNDQKRPENGKPNHYRFSYMAF
jgi:hypothetical protein